MVLSCRKLLSKTSTRVLNPFDVFILIALFSHFEEDVHKKNWLWYSTVDFSQEKVNRLIKRKKKETFLDLYGKKTEGGYF